MADPQQFIEITDFRPGIFSDLFAANQATANTASPTLRGQLAVGNGAAVAENTYDCRADKTGALVPFWKRNNGPTRALLPGGNSRTADYPTNLAAAYLLDARAERRGNRIPLSNDAASYSTLSYGFFFRPSGAGNFYSFTQTVEFYGSGGVSMDTNGWFKSQNTVTEFILNYAGLFDMRAAFGTSNATPLTRYDYTLVTGRIFRTLTGILTSQPIQIGVIPANELSMIGGNLQYWNRNNTFYDEPARSSGAEINFNASVKYLGPLYYDGVNYQADELTLRSLPVASTTNENYPWMAFLCVAHQGRLVVSSWSGQGRFNSYAAIDGEGGDLLRYSPVRAPTAYVDNATGRIAWGFLIPGDTPVSKIGAMGSITADQLMVVKSYGGAQIIQGDMDRPTVRSYPFVESTQGVIVHGISTPVGFVYGSKRGVYAWAGGDTSQLLSPQLEGFFWDHTLGTEGTSTCPYYGGARGRFGWWNECLFVPNNYFLDTTGGGWWRLSGISNTEPYNVYDTNHDGFLLAYPWRLTSTQNIVWHWYDPNQLINTYSWQSQPIIETRGRRLSFQDIHLVATYLGSGTAQITITLTGYDKNGVAVAPDIEVINLTAGPNPQLVWTDIKPNFQAEYVQVRIQATAGSSTQAAPKIHSIKFGVRDDARTPKV